MSDTDKCPRCGADSPEFSPRGFYLCGSSVGVVLHQSELCRERTANGKPTDEPNPNGSTNARLNWWKQRCDALSDELTNERTTHANTRTRAELFGNQLKHAISQCDFWEKRCDEKDAEIAKEHAAHAETRKERDELRSWFKAAQDNYKSVLEQLTRDRKKWEKLMDWANSLGWKDNSEFILKEVNRLDAEAKGGR